MGKKILVIALFLLFLLPGCAITSLKDYKPASQEEASIIAVLMLHNESWNRKDGETFLSLFADEARIMYGRERIVVSKAEYAKIMPERMKVYRRIETFNPKIKIEGDMATVHVDMQLDTFSQPFVFKLRKIGDKWLIVETSY